MKRIISVVLALVLAVSLAGCVFIEKEKEAFDVMACLQEVEALVEAGDLEGAEKLLEQGVRKAEDPEELELYLELVQEMMAEQNDPAGEDTPTVPTQPATEATQPSAGQQVPTVYNMLTDFDREETYQINVFLSNFSEQGFMSYPCDDGSLISFGYSYAKVNNRNVVGVDGYEYYIYKENMDSILKRFFGHTVSFTEGTNFQWFRYENGAYRFPAADGESYSYCSVATSMVSNGDGTYTVAFDVYAHVSPHESMSQFYYMTPAQIAGNSQVNYLYSGTAVVRDYIRSNGAESYQLISYSRQ